MTKYREEVLDVQRERQVFFLLSGSLRSLARLQCVSPTRRSTRIFSSGSKDEKKSEKISDREDETSEENRGFRRRVVPMSFSTTSRQFVFADTPPLYYSFLLLCFHEVCCTAFYLKHETLLNCGTLCARRLLAKRSGGISNGVIGVGRGFRVEPDTERPQ